MTKRIYYISCLLAALLLHGNVAWAQQSDSYKVLLAKDLAAKQAAMPQGNLFSVLKNKGLTPEEREALEFLYAYMPANDIADYSGDFFLANVRASLRAKKAANWTIPDDLFRHFVLPIRVNNENLDSARMVFQEELLPRVKGLSLHDAILEVNHWCHEKVSYQPTDSRTSAPLSTMRTSWGRCGEESTFLVAALRAAGIPARQVYTPRWAHTNDNHAWVEAWVDGKWHFLGACEPEPVLDLGWFNAPASRGMLMHTKVFGNYNGPEEVMERTATYTEINVIDNYTTSAPITVTVKDGNGKAVEGANVEFRIYNYGEFYTVSRQTTASDGAATLSAGLGDMLVYASDGVNFGVRKVSFGKERQADVVLNHKIGETFAVEMDIVPPPEHPNIPEVTADQRAENDRRFALEDSIRHAYQATFLSGDARQTMERLGADAKKYLTKSEGNWRTILHILSSAKDEKQYQRTLDLLSTLSDKDLRDVRIEVLTDALANTAAGADVKKVLAPRVAMEQLVPYRSVIIKTLKKAFGKKWGDAQNTIDYCKKNITVRNDLAKASTYTTPLGVLRAKVADTSSLDVFFVALCRTQGIPAWVDPVTGNTFYEKDGKSVLVKFGDNTEKTLHTGKLQLTVAADSHENDPEYYIHFSLSRHNEKNTFALLNYDEGGKWSTAFKQPVDVETGYYLLTTGTRLASGSVLARLSFFNVNEGSQTEQEIKLREEKEAVSVIGEFNSEDKFTVAKTGKQTSVLNATGRGYFVVGLLAVGQEPTNHALRDIAARKAEFEQWGRTLVLLFASKADYDKYMKSPIPGLPSTVVFGIDTDGSIDKEIRTNMKVAANASLPQFIIGDTFNRVVFESHGYTIGLGDQILKTIKGL